MASRTPGTFDVNVKDFRGGSVVVSVQPTWNVAQVKQEISRKMGVAAPEFKLVFAGQTLSDDITLAGIGVQGYSTLHCIRGAAVEIQPVIKPIAHVERELAHMNVAESPQGQPSTLNTSGGTPTSEHRFFVFCKKPCKAMTPGKLRVRCATCKGGSFVLERGPGGWDDVLTPKKLKGQCYTDTCRATDAEFFFKCSRHPTNADEQCVALHMVRKNTVGVECASCFDVKDTVVVFDCPDKHTLCLDCFMEYCDVQLTDRQFEEHRDAGYTLRCPAKCEGSEIKESHHFRIMGPDKVKTQTLEKDKAK
jgi:parkin